MKLVVEEAESAALGQVLDELAADDLLVASWLLHTELRCAAARRRGIRKATVESVLESLMLVDVERSDLIEAPTVAYGLRSQDALHLATAIRLNVDAIVTYDDEQARAATAAGLKVLAPSAAGASAQRAINELPQADPGAAVSPTLEAMRRDERY